MKRKQQQRIERRRQTAELNLVDEGKGLKVARRGCGPFFGAVLVTLAAMTLLWAGPH